MNSRTIEIRSVPAAEMQFELTRYPQVERLLAFHTMIGGTGPGRRYNLEVLNKSAIVLACATWEAFCEEIASDALDHLAEYAPSSDALPVDLRTSVAQEIARDKHDLAAWRLADDGWRTVLKQRAEKLGDINDRTLSSPSGDKIRTFFREQVGFTGVTESWSWPRHPHERSVAKLDELVHLRNRIAHKGGPAQGTVTLRVAKAGVTLIRRLSYLTISHFDEQLGRATGRSLIQRTKVQLPSS